MNINKIIEKCNKHELRQFGLVVGIVSLLVSAFFFWKNIWVWNYFLYIGCILVVFGFLLPYLLKPIYIPWMILSNIIGWIMTRVILSVIFYLIMTPIGLITRLLGEDFLGLKNIGSSTYWNSRDSANELNQDYEKQF